MTGNVGEWCSDCADVTDSDSDCRRVSRGGSWGTIAQSCRSNYRPEENRSDAINRALGFRVLLP
ncbi:SUMF1/EgtB/PvdO family nonheme iron enzyme [Bacteroides sp. UBA939]|uniref:SUMF1/EgtB/PvdO family nonheme iron enzyme n=1 Tax=Bacteroides sp. UBA939 TaxID=1946092 RepID=UPI0039C8968D